MSPEEWMASKNKQSQPTEAMSPEAWMASRGKSLADKSTAVRENPNMASLREASRLNQPETSYVGDFWKNVGATAAHPIDNFVRPVVQTAANVVTGGVVAPVAGLVNAGITALGNAVGGQDHVYEQPAQQYRNTRDAVAGAIDKAFGTTAATEDYAQNVGALLHAISTPVRGVGWVAGKIAEGAGAGYNNQEMIKDATMLVAGAAMPKAIKASKPIAAEVGQALVQKMGKVGEMTKNVPKTSIAVPAALWATGLVDPGTAAQLGGLIQTGKMLSESAKSAAIQAAAELDRGVMSVHRTAAKSSDAYAGLGDLADHPEVAALKAYNDAVATNQFAEFAQTAGKRLNEKQLESHWADVVKKAKLDPETPMPRDFIETPVRPAGAKYYAGTDISYLPTSEITKLRKAQAAKTAQPSDK